jgi:hypothetical protein
LTVVCNHLFDPVEDVEPTFAIGGLKFLQSLIEGFNVGIRFPPLRFVGSKSAAAALSAPAACLASSSFARQHFLYFLPLPQ